MGNSLEQKLGNKSFYDKIKNSLAGKITSGFLTITFSLGLYGCSNGGSSEPTSSKPSNPTSIIEESWNKTFDGGYNDFAEGIATDSSGNVYVAGISDNGNDYDFRVIKYNSSGSVIWNKKFDSGNVDSATGIATDSSGNVYVAGYSLFDFRTIKYNSTGSVIWNKTFDSGNYRYDLATGIATDYSGNIYVTGFSDNETKTNWDFRTIKYDYNGNIIWNKTFDSGSSDYARGIATNSGNVYVAGDSYNGNNHDLRVIKYNLSDGSVIWNKTFDSGHDDTASGITTDSSGNVYVAGDSRIIKYNSNGDIIWNKTFDDDNYGFLAEGIAIDSYRHAYVTGVLFNDFRTLKYDIEGDLIWGETFDGGNEDHANSIATDSSGNVYVTGYSGTGISYDFRTIKYTQ